MQNKKRLFAPIIVGILVVLYLGTIGIYLLTEPIPILWKIIGLGIPLGLAATMIYVSIERIKELKGGEEDDLGKY